MLPHTPGAVDRAPPAQLAPSHVLTRDHCLMGCSRTGHCPTHSPRRPAIDAQESPGAEIVARPAVGALSLLEVNSPAWGSAPILTAAGTQCTTVQELDDAVKGYWVDSVWRRQADVDAAESWAAFERFPFFESSSLHLPA